MLTSLAITNQTQWLALLDPLAAGQGVDGGRVDRRVRVVIEVGELLLAGKPGCPDPAHGAAAVAVVALGQQQLGEESAVGQLFAFGSVGDLGEAGPDGGQP